MKLLMIAASSLLVIGCPASPDPIFGPVDAERVVITVPCNQVPEQRTCEATAAAFDEDGREIAKAFEWSTGNSEIATVSLKPGFDSTVAIIRGERPGGTTVQVRVRTQPEITDETPLTVLNSNNPDI